MTPNLVYLAIPYWHEDEAVREYRFKKANQATAKLLKQGHAVISPISQCHHMKQQCPDLPNTWDFWLDIDFKYLDHCHTMYLLCIDGWEQSRGVAMEIGYATAKDIPIVKLSPDFAEEV